MKFVHSSIIFLLVLFTSGSSSTNNNKSRARQISRSHFYFSIDLYHRLTDLSSNSNSNVLFSPLNAYSTLSLLFLGTLHSSNSSQQLRKGLHLSHMSYVNIHSGFREVLRDFKNGRQLILRNQLFLRQNISLNPLYEKGLFEYYNTKISRFSGSAGAFIEEWFLSQGLGLSSPMNFLSKEGGDLFSGHGLNVFSEWEIPFRAKDTLEQGHFYLPGGERGGNIPVPQFLMEIPMMNTRGSFPHGYSVELECRVLEIPFVNKRISLFILLPDRVDLGLYQLEKNLTKENMQLILSKLKTNAINVRLPRFKASSVIQLEEAFKNLGIVDIFSQETSELSLIAPGEDLFVSSILQKSAFEAKESNIKQDDSFDKKELFFPNKFIFSVDRGISF
ncbi:SERPINB1 [Lepeophtheirus salmonis]|uniref:SERPINB1 n=1 Tax=Lepeophtheirus salmonis TaxID=72036 RepID=A0A7R8H3L3_LEPSM|nr:SERPINB1 [Lepeophtheirus salmonis]CAF2833863.1 SERPINB1 [Lepeophtheirus salmonis]